MVNKYVCNLLHNVSLQVRRWIVPCNLDWLLRLVGLLAGAYLPDVWGRLLLFFFFFCLDRIRFGLS
jgi:hypothetical protein